MKSDICMNCADKSCYGYDHRITECEDYRPMTNYDLLISKTPEEMAEWLKTIITECSHCPCSETEAFCEKTCKELLTEWLKSPADKEGGT